MLPAELGVWSAYSGSAPDSEVLFVFLSYSCGLVGGSAGTGEKQDMREAFGGGALGGSLHEHVQ